MGATAVDSSRHHHHGGSSGKAIRWLQQHQTSFRAWAIFAAVTTAIFFFLSDRDFSFLLTLSSLVSTFTFLMMIQKIEAQRSMAGVSLKMFECYLILLTSRLISIVPFEGYLPYDRTGDWLYQLTEALSLLLCGSIVYMGRRRFAVTYDPRVDSFKHWVLVLPCLLFALIFHPTLNSFVPADVAWTFALYLEALASLPQLFYFQKEKRVEPFTSHFLAGQALSKLLSFIFWVATYKELNDHTRALKSMAGAWVIVVQIAQLLIMGDFIYVYIKYLSLGVPVQFFVNENV